MPQWVQEKNARFDDPEKRACISRVIKQSTGIRMIHAWTGASTSWTRGRSNTKATSASPGMTLVESLIPEASPAWQRALDVLTDRVQRRRTAVPER